MRIRAIETFTLSDLMFVNIDTLASLQIIQTENHPNKQMQGPTTSGSKESLSIFGLFSSLAKTPQGKQKLRQKFLRPSTDLYVIQERQRTLQVLLRPDNSANLQAIINGLRFIKDMQGVVLHLQKGASNSKGSSFRRGAWGSLQKFVFHVLVVLEGIQALQYDQTQFGITKKVTRLVDLCNNDVDDEISFLPKSTPWSSAILER